MREIKETSSNNENKKTIMEFCPVSFTLDKISGRWKPLIVWNLRHGKKRYSELKKAIPSITEKMLIQHLKQLESDGLVIREVLMIMPPHVEYSLSDSGKDIIPALDAMAVWGLKNGTPISVNRTT
ncbi:putative HTH-type transcriptional regulator YybR [compost metagenome]